MPSVEMFRALNVSTGPHSSRSYKAGATYHGVLNNHADTIVAAGAGRIIAAGNAGGNLPPASRPPTEGHGHGNTSTSRQSRSRRGRQS